MATITNIGTSKAGNQKVAIDIGTIKGTDGQSSAGNRSIRLFGSHVVDGEAWQLNGFLTKVNTDE